MIYEIINPSDPVTIESDSELVACVVTILTGSGKMGLRDENDETVLPLFLFGGFEEWLEKVDLGDFKTFVDEHTEEIVTCLRSAAVASIRDRQSILAALSESDEPQAALRRFNEERRSSMNDICGWMHDYADHLEGLRP